MPRLRCRRRILDDPAAIRIATLSNLRQHVQSVDLEVMLLQLLRTTSCMKKVTFGGEPDLPDEFACDAKRVDRFRLRASYTSQPLRPVQLAQVSIERANRQVSSFTGDLQKEAI